MPATSSTISLVAGGSDDLDDDSRLRPVPTPTPLPSSPPTLRSTSTASRGSLDSDPYSPPRAAPMLSARSQHDRRTPAQWDPLRHVAMHQQRARRPRGRTSDQTAHTFLWGSFGNPRSPFPTVELAPTRFPRPDRKCATYGPTEGPFLAISPTPESARPAEDIPALLQLRHSQIFHGAAFDGRGNYPRRASPWLKTHLLECFYWIQSPQTRTEPLVLQDFSEMVLSIPDSNNRPILTRILASNLERLGRPGLWSNHLILLTRHLRRTRQGTSDFESNTTSLLAGLWCTQTPNLSMERAFDLSRLSSIHSSIGLSATKGRDYLQNINGLLIGPIALSKTETIFNSNEGPLRLDLPLRRDRLQFDLNFGRTPALLSNQPENVEYMHTFSCLENAEIMLVSHQVQRVNVVDASTSVDIPFSVDSSRLRLQLLNICIETLNTSTLHSGIGMERHINQACDRALLARPPPEAHLIANGSERHEATCRSFKFE
ncbi:hypothetical protein C8R43DRAFT_954914 [Mycena crocata]|nr:hypothetical protein C8R43DRAFT_954914 [Mycena crocata]